MTLENKFEEILNDAKLAYVTALNDTDIKKVKQYIASEIASGKFEDTLYITYLHNLAKFELTHNDDPEHTIQMQNILDDAFLNEKCEKQVDLEYLDCVLKKQSEESEFARLEYICGFIYKEIYKKFVLTVRFIDSKHTGENAAIIKTFIEEL